MRIYELIFMAIIFMNFFVPLAEQQEDAKYFYEKGQEKFASGDFGEAAEFFSDARSEDEFLLDAWYGEGLSYYKIGRYEESIQVCDQILHESVFDAEALDKFDILAADTEIAYEKSKGVPLYHAGEENSGNVHGGLHQSSEVLR
jgi:tetratricopeptide (TPR) repeat protein